MLTQEDLKSQIGYNPSSGKIYRLKNYKVLAALTSKGYLSARINGRTYLVHRLIWLYHYGYMPNWPRVIDHIDGDPTNNRLENLREVTLSQNIFYGRHISRYSAINKWGVKLGDFTVFFESLEEARTFATISRRGPEI